MTLEFKRDALADLENIKAYIAKQSPHAAARMANMLVAGCGRLETFPDRGRRGRMPGTRELTTMRPYVIVYRHVEGLIEILRIWHGRQQRGRG
jgi:toxin ParE1/3/4